MNIFDYDEIHLYLRDHHAILQQKNSSFSIRSWAKKLGLPNHSSLVQALSGKRGVSEKIQNLLLKDLNLSSRDERMFELLAEKSRAKSNEDLLIFKLKLKKLAPEKLDSQIIIEDIAPFEDPLLFHILELVDWDNFKPAPLWVQKRLTYSCTLQRIQDALDYLNKMNLIEKKGTKFKRRYAHLSFPDKSPSISFVRIHQNAMVLAKEVIESTAIKEREYNTYCFNMKKSAKPKLKKRVQDFYKEIIKEFNIEGEVRDDAELIQISSQIFPLAKKE